MIKILISTNSESAMLKITVFPEWLNTKSQNFSSLEIQNEILKEMSLLILRDIVECIKNAAFHSIMVDETSDVSSKGQAVFCVC